MPNNLHIKFFCKWCGRRIGGCLDSCAGPHSHQDVESCATCAHRPAEELLAIEAMPDDPEATHALLSMVMDNPPTLHQVEQWMPGQRRGAEDWAGREHLYASDNFEVERIRKPSFILETEDTEEVMA